MTHSIEVAKSILSTAEANESIFSKLIEDNNAGDRSLEESFEAVILGTRVYSKAFTGILTPQVNGGFNDEGTVTHDTMTTTIEDVYYDAVSSAADGAWLRNKLLTTELVSIPFGGRFDTAMKALNIDGDLMAVATSKYSARRPDELSFTQADCIQQIRKVSLYWYYGEKMTAPEGEAVQARLKDAR
jgi:hypothetical protein